MINLHGVSECSNGPIHWSLHDHKTLFESEAARNTKRELDFLAVRGACAVHWVYINWAILYLNLVLKSWSYSRRVSVYDLMQLSESDLTILMTDITSTIENWLTTNETT